MNNFIIAHSKLTMCAVWWCHRVATSGLPLTN